MEVRDATPNDANAIARLNADAWREAFQGIVNDEYLATHDGRPAARREVLESPQASSMQLVVESDGTVVGWLWAQPSNDVECDRSKVFEVEACYVAPSHWRQGVGRLLMEALLAHLVTSKWEQVVLWTARDTPASQAFYRSLGFELDGHVKDHSVADGSVIPVVRLSRDCLRYEPSAR